MGPCQVIEVLTSGGRRMGVEDLKSQVLCQRVLFKTNSFPDPDNWNSDFCSLSPELIEFLAQQGVRLVGIDTPSIDPETSCQLEAHHMIFAKDMALLEGLFF